MDVTREQRLAATQRAYEEWAEKTTFTSETGASDEDEAKLLDILLDQGLIQPE